MYIMYRKSLFDWFINILGIFLKQIKNMCLLLLRLILSYFNAEPAGIKCIFTTFLYYCSIRFYNSSLLHPIASSSQEFVLFSIFPISFLIRSSFTSLIHFCCLLSALFLLAGPLISLKMFISSYHMGM